MSDAHDNYWTRLHGRSVSRRTLLRGVAVGGAGLAGAALIGCGGDDDEDDVIATGTPALVTEAGVGEIDDITGVAGEEPGTYEATGPEAWIFEEASILRFAEILEDLGGGRPKVYGAKALSPAPASGVALHGNSAPWTDIRAREAFTRAIDRDKAIEILGQGEGVKVGPGVNRFYENMHLPMDDPDLVDWLRFDPQRARELLAAIRADDGVDVDRTLQLVITSESQAQGDRAVFLKQMLAEVGFNFEIIAIPSAQYATRAWRRSTADFDLRTAGSFSRPQEQLRMFHTESRLLSQTVCMCDTELDAMIEDWEQTIDADEVDRKARDIQRWLILHWAVAFPMYNDFLRFLYKITLRNINPDHIPPESWGWIDESYLEG